MDGAIITQGKFAQGDIAVDKYVKIRQGCDWMEVRNATQIARTDAGALGVKYEWQLGLAADTAWVYNKSANTNVLNLSLAATGGFTLVDSSVTTPLAAVAVSAISAAAIPVVTKTNNTQIQPGDVVRIIAVAGAAQLGGFDFTVGYNTLSGTTFSLDYMSQIVAGTNGFYRKIPFNPIYYPRIRYITKVVTGATTVITLSVTHGYQIGQKVSFRVPAAFGMVELDRLQGTIIAIDTTTTTGNSITVDIDSTSFTAFAWPLTGTPAFSPALVVPVGENEAYALQVGVSDLTDRTINLAFIGMKLAAGDQSPAGDDNDVMYWKAGKSFSDDPNGSDVVDNTQI